MRCCDGRTRGRRHGGTSEELMMGESAFISILFVLLTPSVYIPTLIIVCAHDHGRYSNELWFHTIQVTRGDIESHLESTLGQIKLQQRSVPPPSAFPLTRDLT